MVDVADLVENIKSLLFGPAENILVGNIDIYVSATPPTSPTIEIYHVTHPTDRFGKRSRCSRPCNWSGRGSCRLG